MLFSLEWVLRLCPTDQDVEHIVASLTDRGLTVDSVERGRSDTVLDIDVPANRPDCLEMAPCPRRSPSTAAVTGIITVAT